MVNKLKNEKTGEELDIIELNKRKIISISFYQNKKSEAKKSWIKRSKKNEKILVELNPGQVYFNPGSDLATVRFTDEEIFNKINSVVHKDRIYEEYKHLVSLSIKQIKTIIWQ